MRWTQLVSIACLLAAAQAGSFTTHSDTSTTWTDAGVRKMMLQAMLWLTGQDR